MIIGITGKAGSGKDTLAEYLIKKSFCHHSLSDMIRYEADRKKIKKTRENLIRIGNELREKHGPDILARLTLKKLGDDRHHIITSIRNPAEIEALKERKDFLLIGITAPQKQRFDRNIKRGRVGDSGTFEEFKRTEDSENSGDPSKQQLDKCLSMARVIIRNDSDIEAFYDKIDRVLRRWFPKIQPKRPSWDNYFMNIAKTVSRRSNCMKRKVAAIIVKDKRIISTGYNGTPRNTINCDEGGCKRCSSFAQRGTKLEDCLCSHGEENAIVQAAYHGVSIKDAIIYTTFSPCLLCTKMIINSGIREVIYNQSYPLNGPSIRLLKEAGIRLRKVEHC